MVTWTSILPEALPNEFDPNLHCSVCDKAYKSTITYRNHLRGVYNMDLTYLKPKANLNIDPDINNSNNYCNSCNWTYSSAKQYLFHLQKVHNIAPKQAPDLNISPDIDDPDFY